MDVAQLLGQPPSVLGPDHALAPQHRYRSRGHCAVWRDPDQAAREAASKPSHFTFPFRLLTGCCLLSS